MPGRCGATNPTLGLRCDREPHPPGTAHYQDDGNGIRAWGATSKPSVRVAESDLRPVTT